MRSCRNKLNKGREDVRWVGLSWMTRAKGLSINKQYNVSSMVPPISDQLLKHYIYLY